MQPAERIEVRKIYLGSAALFGLLYGLVLGIIMAVFFLISGLLGSPSEPGLFSFLPFGGVYLISLFVLIFYVVFGLIAVFISALLYNLVAKMGGKLHFGLAEYDKPVKGKVKAGVNLGTSARVDGKTGNHHLGSIRV